MPSVSSSDVGKSLADEARFDVPNAAFSLDYTFIDHDFFTGNKNDDRFCRNMQW